MKHKKQLIMILIVVFLLVGLGTLAASDVTKNDTSTNKNTEKNTKIETQNIKDTTKTPTTQTQENQKQIQKTIKEKNKKQDTEPITIESYERLSEELRSGSGTKILNITKNITLRGSPILTDSITNLTINGNQKTINGNGTHQFLTINGEQTVTINNLTITNCNASMGGAIWNQDGNLTITNSNLTHNNAGNYGGAIWHQDGNLNITESNLNYNTARNEGGSVYNNFGNLTITNSNLTHNNANEGGAITNKYGTSTIRNSNLTHNNATNGGAIKNIGTLNITDSNLTHNNAGTYGGAIYAQFTTDKQTVILFNSTFIENKGTFGAVIYKNGGYGTYNITYNTFKNNTATSDKETLNLGTNIWEKTIEENTYDNTDINLKTINLTTQDQKTTYQYNEDITLNYTVELQNPDYYDADILDKINKTLYIDTIENSTTKEKNYTLSKLEHGKHTLYYKTCNIQSKNLTLIVPYDSEIKTDKTTYDHVDGIKNKITLNITDPSEEKGTINITVKDQDEYKELSSYSNVGNGYQLSTDALVEALENNYPTLNQSYVINVTYSSEYTNPSSTNFTLNIIKKRNTTIGYEIINNTEGNVQINITVLDAIYKTPISDAIIQLTGALTNETTTGIITDNTLTPGKYNITVTYNGTEDYNKSNTTIDFTVEINKDKKIAELENNITKLTQDLKDAQQEIQNLNQTITELNKTTNTTINIKPVTSSVGSQVNLTATITDETGNKVTTGKVLFKVNGITLKDEIGNVIYAIVNNGEANLTTKTQAAWIKNTTNIQAVYSGEKPYKSSRANTTNITITKGKATITFDKPTITAKAGQTITLKAKILDSNGDRINNDKVVFKLNGRTLTDKDGKTLYARVVDGEAVLEYTIPETYNAKTYNLTAVFGGNYYERTQTQGTITLEKKATTITPENITTTDGKTTIKAQIRDETGKTLTSTTKVAIKINGKTITTTNSTNGTIDTSFTTTLKPGTYELTIISGENGQYKKATLTTVLKI